MTLGLQAPCGGVGTAASVLPVPLRPHGHRTRPPRQPPAAAAVSWPPLCCQNSFQMCPPCGEVRPAAPNRKVQPGSKPGVVLSPGGRPHPASPVCSPPLLGSCPQPPCPLFTWLLRLIPQCPAETLETATLLGTTPQAPCPPRAAVQVSWGQGLHEALSGPPPFASAGLASAGVHCCGFSGGVGEGAGGCQPVALGAHGGNQADFLNRVLTMCPH